MDSLCRKDFNFFVVLFIIYFWLCWAFVAVQGLSLVAGSGGSSPYAVCRLLIMVASWCRAQALGRAGFSSCGVQA